MIIKKSRTAWGLPVGPWANQKIIILPNNIAFYKDNMKKKNVRRKKVDILNKEVNTKKGFESKHKNVLPCIWF